MKIKLGKYMHYKGHVCEVIGIGKHSETLEDLVFYIQLGMNEKYGMNSVWARPVEMWNKMVEWDGKKVRRFIKISDE